MRLELAAAWQSTRRLGQPLGGGGLASGSNVDDMRNRLKTLGALAWGTKAQLWPRVVHAVTRRELQKRDGAWLADRAREAAEAGGQGELRVLQENRQQISTRAMKSHTYRISRGVRGASKRQAVRSPICSGMRVESAHPALAVRSEVLQTFCRLLVDDISSTVLFYKC